MAVTQSSHPLDQVRRRIDLDQLKLPLGFIRCVELIFTLIVMSAKNGWDFDVRFECKHQNGTTNSTGSWNHLRLNEYTIGTCSHTTALLFPDFNIGIGVSLYSFLAVITLCFVVGTLLVYLFGYSAYVSDERLPILDLTMTIILSFGWFIGTLCFSMSVGRVEDATADETVIEKALTTQNICVGSIDSKCHEIKSYAMYAPLTVATLAGAGLVLLFFANIWFCYKETSGFRQRTHRNQMLHQMQQEPYTLE